MRTVAWCVLLVHLVASVAQAQTFKDLQIQLGAYTSNKDGGDKPVGVWFSTGPVVIGKQLASTFSIGESGKAFTVSSDGSLRENATAAWRIEVTPTQVVRDEDDEHRLVGADLWQVERIATAPRCSGASRFPCADY